MAANTTQIGGYECDWVESPPDDIKCQICLTVARDPQQHGGNKGCGKIFCSSCISAHQQNSKDCPNCKQQLSLFEDKRSVRHINALKVKCNNLSNGCKWVGELGYQEEHLSKCDHALLPCDNECKKDSKPVKILRKDLKDHLSNHCPRRQYECPHCKEKGEHQERTTTHLGTCPQVKIHCPNDKACSDLIPRCQVSSHRSTSCQYEPVSCKYAAVGCKETPLRKDIQKHESDNQLHLRADQLLKLTNTVAELHANFTKTTTELTKKNADLAKATAELTKKNADLTKKTTELAAKNTELTKTTTEVTKKNADLAKSTAELTAKNAALAKTTAELTTKNTALTKSTTELTAKNANLTKITTDLTAKNAALTKTTTELTAKNAALAKTTTELTAKNAALTKITTELTAKNTAVTKTTTELTAKNAVLTKTTTELTKKIAELEKKVK